MGLPPDELDALLARALVEDLGPGDATSEAAVPADAWAAGRLTAKAPGVLAGLRGFERVFALLDGRAVCRFEVEDGAGVAPGDVVATLHGPARALLSGERTALNLLQRLSGIATLSATYVAAARRDGAAARILDTRKTTPGLRMLEKYAVRCGGAENHRIGLFDEAMIKDNHTDLAERSVAEIVRDLRERHGAEFRVTVEARTEEEALAAVRAGADYVLLDNMSPAEMGRLAPLLRAAADPVRGVELEASGGITLESIAAVAASGVDRISVGALTHSAPALDLSLALVPAGAPEAAGAGR